MMSDGLVLILINWSHCQHAVLDAACCYRCQSSVLVGHMDVLCRNGSTASVSVWGQTLLVPVNNGMRGGDATFWQTTLDTLVIIVSVIIIISSA